MRSWTSANPSSETWAFNFARVVASISSIVASILPGIRPFEGMVKSAVRFRRSKVRQISGRSSRRVGSPPVSSSDRMRWRKLAATRPISSRESSRLLSVLRWAAKKQWRHRALQRLVT